MLKELRNSQVSCSAEEHLQPEILLALEEPGVEGEVSGLDTAPQSHHKGQEETGTQLLPPESVSPAGNHGLNWCPGSIPELVSRLSPVSAAGAETAVGQRLGCRASVVSRREGEHRGSCHGWEGFSGK